MSEAQHFYNMTYFKTLESSFCLNSTIGQSSYDG